MEKNSYEMIQINDFWYLYQLFFLWLSTKLGLYWNWGKEGQPYLQSIWGKAILKNDQFCNYPQICKSFWVQLNDGNREQNKVSVRQPPGLDVPVINWWWWCQQTRSYRGSLFHCICFSLPSGFFNSVVSWRNKRY